MHNNSIVLVLWCDAFDELAATSFTTTLRRAGLRVKLVGLSFARSTGAGGIALVPEITLEQAMSLCDLASAVILPAGAGAIRRMNDDPRPGELISRTCQRHAVLVTSSEAAGALAELVARCGAAPVVLTYPNNLTVIEFALRLAEHLACPGILPDFTCI